MTELLFVQPAAIASGTARERTDRIKLGLGTLEAELQAAIDDSIWLELGYEKFADWWHGEGFEGFRLQGTLYDWAARQLKADYPDMGPRAIGRSLGSSEKTAERSLGPSNAGPDDHGSGVRPFTGPIHKPQPPVWSEVEQDLLAAVEAGQTVVASLRGQHANLIAWAEETERYVRVDRRTEWGNPFEMPVDGDRDTVIKNYALYYLPNKPSLLEKIDTLRGKVLGCWCAPDACHGDVLKEVAEQ